MLNLASDEYYKSVKESKIQAKIIKPVFLDEKNGKFKVISFMQKARGLMARFMIEHQINEVKALQEFNSEGYFFDKENSTAQELVFKRHEQTT